MMILLANSMEHKMSSPPVAGTLKTLIKARSAAESAGRAVGKSVGGVLNRVMGKGSGANAAGAAPGPWPIPFIVIISPSATPAPLAEVMFDLRNCECVVDAVLYSGRITAMPPLGKAPAECKCKDACPKEVTIGFLTDAIGQDVCSLRRYTGYGCSVGCFGPDKAVAWYGHSCAVPDAPLKADAKAEPNFSPCAALVVSPPPSPSHSPAAAAPIVAPVVTWDPATRADLRGLTCELRLGKEVCFSEDSQGRTECPTFVDSAYLRDPPSTGIFAVGSDITQQCGPSTADRIYCTAHCQPGNDRVQWWTHDIAYCYSKDGAWACPSMHATVPKASFTIQPWSAPTPSPNPCKAAAAAGVKPAVIKDLSVGMLTHEPVAFALTMATYEEYGLFDVLDEFIIFLNGRNPSLEAVVAPYQAKHPGLFRLIGNATNIGIARGMVSLTNAAKNPFFLFLERDFWLVEPSTCVVEQLLAGLELLKTGSVHVIRYRHRIKAGRPNWAENFFKGHEDDAFVGRQPNLACNIFYWIHDVETRWPNYFTACGKDPLMICSDSFYCNWTNNPQMWEVKWWNREYVDLFDSFKRNDPW